MPNSLLACMTGEPLIDIKHSYVDVGGISILISIRNDVRRMLMVQNDGTNDVYIMFGRPAILHQGMCLKAGGASALFALCHGTLCPSDMYGITTQNKIARILVTEGF